MRVLYREYVANSIDDLAKFFIDIRSGTGNPFVYRGQADSTQTLITSLERKLPGKAGVLRHDDERRMLGMFKRIAHRYTNELGVLPANDDDIEWLGLMRHFGAATRLLDFTYSPYVAAFFAICDSPLCGKQDAAIWAVNAGCLRKTAYSHLQQQGGQIRLDRMSDGMAINAPRQQDGLWGSYGEESCHAEIRRNIATACLASYYRVPGVLQIESHRTNQRMHAQRGLFLMPTSIEHSFQYNLVAALAICPDDAIGEPEPLGAQSTGHLYGEVALAKVIIPRSKHAYFQTMLHSMNLRHDTLYPDVHGLVKSLAYDGVPRIGSGG